MNSLWLCVQSCALWGCCPCPCHQGPLLGCWAGAPWGSPGHIFLCSRETWGTWWCLQLFPCLCKAAVSGCQKDPGLCWSLADSGRTQPPGSVVPQKRLPDGFSSQISLLWGWCLFQAVEQSKPRQSEGSDCEILATAAASSCWDLCF